MNGGEARRKRGAATSADDRPVAPEAQGMAKRAGMLGIDVADGRCFQLQLGLGQAVGTGQGPDMECAVGHRQHEKTEK